MDYITGSLPPSEEINNDKNIDEMEVEMNQKVEFFANEHAWELKEMIDKFAKTHHIESISYSVCKFGYTGYHHCCVLYTDK